WRVATGGRLGANPKAKRAWTEFPNVGGAFSGRPGMLKPPAMGEALRPIHHLEAEAAKENEVAAQAYKVGLSAYKLRAQVAASLAKRELKTGKSPDIKFEVGEEPEEPLPVRYRTNDSSYEAIAELLIS